MSAARNEPAVALRISGRQGRSAPDNRRAWIACALLVALGVVELVLSLRTRAVQIPVVDYASPSGVVTLPGAEPWYDRAVQAAANIVFAFFGGLVAARHHRLGWIVMALTTLLLAARRGLGHEALIGQHLAARGRPA